MRRTLALTSPGGIAGIALLLLMTGLQAPPAQAQAWPSGKVKPGISAYSTFVGSVSNSGTVLEMSNDVGYNLSSIVGFDVVVPVYFVVVPTQESAFATATAGIANIAVDAHASLSLPGLKYQPTATLAFPTSSTARGFSTGVMTYDLDNYFEHGFGILDAFIDIDVGNSLNNGNTPGRVKIQRPYMTLGQVLEVTAGPHVQITDRWSASANLYQAMPWGTQTIYSRILPPGIVGAGGLHNRVFETSQTTVGGPSLTSDNGYGASVGFSPTRFLDLTAAYDHSIHFDLNTISFSAGFNLTELFNRKRN